MATLRARLVGPRRSLSPEHRRELLRLIEAVPPDADRDHPAVLALVAYHQRIKTENGIPWWAPNGAAYLRVGGMCSDGRTSIAVGLAEMRRLAECDDWGEPLHG